MLHMLRDFFACHPAPAGPPILHATNATPLRDFSHAHGPSAQPPILHMLHDFFSFAIQPPPDPRFYMLHVLRDFRMLTVPRHSPPFYMLHMLPGLFRFLHARAGAAPFYMLPMLPALFRLPRQEPPFLLPMLPALFDFFHGTLSPRATRVAGSFGFSDSLVHAAYACLSCSTCSIQINVG